MSTPRLTFDTLLSQSKLDTLFWFTFDTQFWYTQKSLKYTLIHTKVYQIMVDDRKPYLNCMKCVWNGMKRFQILMYQKHVKSVYSKVYLISCPILIGSKVYQSSARACFEKMNVMMILDKIISSWHYVAMETSKCRISGAMV